MTNVLNEEFQLNDPSSGIQMAVIAKYNKRKGRER